MRIVIATSKSWFLNNLESNFFSNSEILWITEKAGLTSEVLTAHNPSYVFFPHWNWKIEKDIYENFKCVVFHTAPLPYGRGGSPIQNLILNGFESSPVNALLVGPEIDAGDILAARGVSLEGKLSDIFERISTVVEALIIEILQNDPIPHPQIGEPHVFRRRRGGDNEIPIGPINIVSVYDYIRMLDAPEYPKTYIQHGNLVIEFSDAELINGSVQALATFKINNTDNY